MIIYENNEIYVRPIMSSDRKKKSYISWFCDQEVCKYNTHGKMSHGINYSESQSNPIDAIIWAVIKKKINDMESRKTIEALHIGNVVLEIDWINRNAEFTCIFGEKEYWGQGYCTQAMKWLFTHGFNKLNLHKIWLGTANPRMGKAAENVGMKVEAELWDQIFIEGQFKKIIRYAIRTHNE